MIETGIMQDGSLFTEPARTMSEQRIARKQTMDMRLAEAVRVTRDGGPWVVWCELNDESSALVKAIDGAVEITGSDSLEKKEEILQWFIGNKCICDSKILRAKLASWKKKPHTNSSTTEKTENEDSRSQKTTKKRTGKKEKSTQKNTTRKTKTSGQNDPKKNKISTTQTEERNTPTTKNTEKECWKHQRNSTKKT
ncbi:MAG: hypothetical protein GY700_01685, partial [Propionibacteriaceae bacterium]|nr:hypothetical protein [Propionibacteriaceae bacterium]